MKPLTILCDADDTIENLSSHWIDALNKAHNRIVKKEEVKSWDLTTAYPDLTAQEVFEPIYQKDFWEKITPINGSAYYLKKLIKDGHRVYIVTATNFETSDAKVAKLLKMFPFLSYENIIVAHNKQLINGDILIDDGVHNLIGGNYIKFLYHQPNNSNFNEKEHDITRVFSWKEIYERICNLVA